MERASGRVIGIDLGTQSTKVLVYDADRREVLARASEPHQLLCGDGGSREQLAEWWVSALRGCFAQLPAAVKAGVKALAVSGQQHGFVPIGRAGEVLAPVKLWNDTSTMDECAAIHRALSPTDGEQAAVRLAGNALAPGYTAPKILWLKRHRPELYAQLTQILLPHDYLNYYLTGRFAMECGDASGTGLLNIRTRTWSAELLRAVDAQRDLAALLPPLLAPQAMVGEVLPEVAAKLGLPQGVVVAAGGGDNMMAAIGTGAVAPGRLTISLGTSGTLYAYAEQPVVAAGGEFAAFCSSTGGYLPLLCTMNCTAATELMRDLLDVPLTAMEALLREVPAGAGGVVALPFFNGERTPACPKGEGAFFGLTPGNTSRAHLLRAVVEATALALRTGLSAMRQQGVVTRQARVTGGGSASQAWLRILADVLNLEISVQAEAEAAAFGASLQALWCLERRGGVKAHGIDRLVETHAPPSCGVLTPQSPDVALYDGVFARYQRHLALVKTLYE